jgi:hypothetical protein
MFLAYCNALPNITSSEATIGNREQRATVTITAIDAHVPTLVEARMLVERLLIIDNIDNWSIAIDTATRPLGLSGCPCCPPLRPNGAAKQATCPQMNTRL